MRLVRSILFLAAGAFALAGAALARAPSQDLSPLAEVFSELFKQFESPSAYEPSRFVAGMKKVDAAIR